MKCYIPTFQASREGQKCGLVFSVRVRADLSLNLANFNINGFFNGRAQKRPDRTFVLLKICDLWVYNTPRVDIPGDTQKKLVVLCDTSL